MIRWVLVFKLPKKLTIEEKKEIIQRFTEGNNIEFLSKKFNCTKLTIIRNLKKDLGEKKYKELNNSIKLIKGSKENDDISKKQFNNQLPNQEPSEIRILDHNPSESDYLPEASFLEITPLVDYEIGDAPRKELSSTPILNIDLPKIVYMVVDKKIELEIKLLKDYPDWSFLPKDDLNRKTIEIFFDLKIAKRFCNKDQKVIKVPNSDVFRITAPILISRGISRIVSADKLIAL